MAFLDSLRSVARFRGPEWNASRRHLSSAASIDDLRALARKRLPRGVFDYIDGGAEDELSLDRNQSAFRRLEFNPRVLRRVGDVDTSVEMMGGRIPFPVVLAPTGFMRIANSEGELAVARAASRAGIPYTLSSLSTRSIEEVRAASSGELWFQVYVWRDKGLLAEILQRAAAADYSTIVITVDTAVLGRRERDVRRGFTLPPKLGLSTIFDGLAHPGWTWDFLRHEPIRFANIVGKSVGDGTDPVSLSEFFATQFDPWLSWDDISWFRERWQGKVVIKGVQSVEDAVLAADLGLDAVALSNHGGRQLDGSPPPIELVGPVAEAVGDRIAILCDGGVRRGSDVVKALALGASACMVGRAYLYGLAVAGESGVDHALGLLSDGVQRTLALCGFPSFKDIGRDVVRWRPTA